MTDQEGASLWNCSPAYIKELPSWLWHQVVHVIIAALREIHDRDRGPKSQRLLASPLFGSRLEHYSKFLSKEVTMLGCQVLNKGSHMIAHIVKGLEGLKRTSFWGERLRRGIVNLIHFYTMENDWVLNAILKILLHIVLFNSMYSCFHLLVKCFALFNVFSYSDMIIFN